MWGERRHARHANPAKAGLGPTHVNRRRDAPTYTETGDTGGERRGGWAISAADDAVKMSV
jgi:hypothetical protein